MKTFALTALAALALTASQTANAGALGTVVTAGLHQERAYYYSRQGEQFRETQMRFNSGIGIEALIGDKDEKIQGIVRFLWMSDAQATNPNTVDSKGDKLILAEHPDYDSLKNKNSGVLGLGVQWGLLGDPSDKQIVLTSIVGSGFITTDNTEYVMLEVGAGGTYNLTETMQATANIALTVRNRKALSFGPNMYAGVRYLFD